MRGGEPLPFRFTSILGLALQAVPEVLRVPQNNVVDGLIQGQELCTHVIVTHPAVKRRIRMAAEEEEHEFYTNLAPQEWLDALAPLGTDADKPFLESAPYLIVIFSRSYSLNHQGKKVKHYYVSESVGIATGILITALHQSGLVTLTHTPSPMRFLNEILERPQNEHPFLILVAGYPAEDAEVPKITKKPFKEITTVI